MAILLTFGLFWLAGMNGVHRLLEKSSFEERLGFGLVTGTLLGAWAGLLLYFACGMTWGLKTGLFLLGSAAVFSFKKDWPCLFTPQDLQGLRQTYSGWRGFFRIAGILLWVSFWLRVAHQTVFQIPDGIFIHVRDNYGDQNINAAYAARFAWGVTGLENPVWAGSLLNRHFLLSFFLSLFVRENWDIVRLFQIQTFLSGSLFSWALGRLTRRATESEACAWLAPVLFIFSGGLGFIPPANPGNGWPNFLSVTLCPQRATLFTLPAACFILILIWQNIQAPRVRTAAATGFFTGLLPTACIFSFLSMLWLGFSQLIGRYWRQWLSWGLPLLLIAAPQLFYHLGSGSAVSKEFWTYGWLNEGKKGFFPLFYFWLKETGMLLPLLGMAFFSPSVPKSLKRFGFSFLGLFLIPNVLRITNWDWDTVRILMYWFLGSLLLITKLLREIWKEGRAAKAVVMIVLLLLSYEGAFKTAGILKGEGPFQIHSSDHYEFSKEIRRMTSPADVILAAPEPNHPVFWSGRVAVMGYAGWVWSGGWGDHVQRENDIKTIYTGGPDAKELLRKYSVGAIVVSDFERRKYSIDEAFLDSVAVRRTWKEGFDLWQVKNAFN